MSKGFGWYGPSRPIEVEGGIKARSRRGSIGESWWSARFIDVLEHLGMGGRLSRGRNYARRGQVLDLWIEPGVVSADVQGSRKQPYRVKISLRAYDRSEWATVLDALAADAWYTAKLLAGEMPEDIVDLFNSLNLTLFPTSSRDLAMDCSCPDWEVPCKHLAATFYLLAERFDEDPFGILAWRGREREELLDALSAKRVGAPPTDRADEPDAAPDLSECLDTYWTRGPASSSPPPPAAIVPSDAILAQAPTLDLAVQATPLTDCLRPAYLPHPNARHVGQAQMSAMADPAGPDIEADLFGDDE